MGCSARCRRRVTSRGAHHVTCRYTHPLSEGTSGPKPLPMPPSGRAPQVGPKRGHGLSCWGLWDYEHVAGPLSAAPHVLSEGEVGPFHSVEETGLMGQE